MSTARTGAVELAKLLGESRWPIYVVDEDQRIAFCNLACARWMRVKAADLVGQKCAYCTPSDDDECDVAAAVLCPPPQCFRGQMQSAVICRTASDGKAAYRRGHFFPMADGDDAYAPVLAILEGQDLPPGVRDEPGEAARLHEEVRDFRAQMAGRYRLDSLLGKSPAMVRVRAQIELAATTRASVLIVGPRGSGKEHAAKAIHYGSARAGHFVPLDCGVLETNVLRSTLRTLSTGHLAPKESSGTLLLEDVDRMPREAQEDLWEIVRGGTFGMQIIGTAVAGLEETVAEGRMSRELACALSTLIIELPALSAHLDDLPLLAQAFLEEANAAGLKQVGSFSPEALDLLVAYSWPGDVDELAKFVRESHQRSQGAEITTGELPSRIGLAADAAAYSKRTDESIVLEDFLGNVERELIERAMRRAKGNKSKAAKLLGLTRPRLYRRLVQLGLEKPNGEAPD